MATQTIVDALDRLTNVLKGEDEGGSGGGSVKLGNFAMIGTSSNLPTEYYFRYTEDGIYANDIKINDKSAIKSSNIYSIAEGLTIEIKCGSNVIYPTATGPVDACILIPTQIGADDEGIIEQYNGVVYDAETKIMTIPIHDVPEPLIGSGSSIFYPEIVVKFETRLS